MYLQPMFYFPSTIAWLDDDPLFIQALSSTFEDKHPLKIFHTPQDCLNFFENYTAPLEKIPFLQGRTQDEYYETLEHTPVDFNVLSISQLAQYEKRRQEISVLVIDLNMPHMNGLEVLEILKHLPMKKILLTGEADHQKAINAFNDNIIDRFIQKSSPTLIAELKKYAYLLNQQYFCEYTQPLLVHLETERKIPLSDPLWVDFFANWCQENDIREYYLIDKIGSFLCYNHNNEAIHFILHTNHSLNSFINAYEEEDEEESIKPFINAVKAREKIPFFGFGKEAWQFKGDQWASHFYPCETLQGRELYYWHVIRG